MYNLAYQFSATPFSRLISLTSPSTNVILSSGWASSITFRLEPFQWVNGSSFRVELDYLKELLRKGLAVRIFLVKLRLLLCGFASKMSEVLKNLHNQFIAKRKPVDRSMLTLLRACWRIGRPQNYQLNLILIYKKKPSSSADVKKRSRGCITKEQNRTL